MQRLSYPTETVLTNKINGNRIVLSFKDGHRKPLGTRGESLYRTVGDSVNIMTISLFGL